MLLQRHIRRELPIRMDEDLWARAQSQGTPAGASLALGSGANIKDADERLLKQGLDAEGQPLDASWHLDDAELDLAAYEQLLLSLPEQHLSARERDTFGYVGSRFGYSKGRQHQIHAGVTRGAQLEAFEEELLEAAEQEDTKSGWVEKAGEKKKGVKGGAFKRRWFHLEDSQIVYSAKPDDKKAKGSIDLTTATSCEAAGPMEPLVFYVNLPTRKFVLRCADPFDTQSWTTVISQVISHNREAKEGFLEKRGAKNHSFKDRWFRILGTKMYYYKKQGDGKPAGTIELETATSCRVDKEDPEGRCFNIGVDGRDFVLRARDSADRDSWVENIAARCPELSGMDGFLLKIAKRGKKGQKRWFKLLGKRLVYFKKKGDKHAEGEIPLERATGCRPGDSQDGTVLVIEVGRALFPMKAETPEACRAWITAINESIQSASDDLDDGAEYDDADMPNTHLMVHRFQLLREKTDPAEHFGSVGEFLRWRKRQLVILGSGLHHQIDHLRETKGRAHEVSSEQKLDKALKGLKVIQNILSDAKYDVSEWTYQDDQTYQERLTLLNKHLDVVFESTDLVPLSEWAEDPSQVPAIICHFPLHLGSFFVERLMRKACFELEEFGGGLDFQLDNVAVLLQHVGHRLRFLDGLYDVVFACALVEQYKSVALQEQESAQEIVEVLGEEIGRVDADFPALATRSAEVLLLHVQKFAMTSLSSYHDLAESTYIAHFVEVFAGIMRLRRQMPETVYQRLERQISESVDKRYTALWAEAERDATEEARAGGGEDEYEDLVDREVDTGIAADPLSVLQHFCDLMAEQIETEVGEYAAYIGTQMENSDDASKVVVKTIADRLNADIMKAFGSIDEMSEVVMICWASLRALEEKLVDVLVRCGLEGEDAKPLKVDAALVKVACKWIDEKEKQFNERMNSSIDQESWEPFGEDVNFAACAVDLVSMLISVAKQYFEAELPVSAKVKIDSLGRPVWSDQEGLEEKAVVQILADKFGLSLQKFGHKIMQQCGDEPRQPWRAADKKSVRGRATTMGKELGKGLMSHVRHKEQEDSEEEEEEIVADADAVDIDGMCIRMATINYVADRCDDMCNELVIGCEQRMYTADWVPKALEAREIELKKMVRSLADTCSATIVYVRLKETLHEKAYRPLPSKSSIKSSDLFDQLDGFLETVMTNIPDDCYLEFKRISDSEAEDVPLREIILEQMLFNIIYVLQHTLGEFRGSRLMELTEEDEETDIAEVDIVTVQADTIELAGYFEAGIRPEVAQQITEKLNETWERVKGEAIDAKGSGKTAHDLDKESKVSGSDLASEAKAIGGAAAALTGGLTAGIGASLGLKKKDEGDFSATGFFDDDDDDDDDDDADATARVRAVTENLTSSITGGMSSGMGMRNLFLCGCCRLFKMLTFVRCLRRAVVAGR